ncbi:MAG: hypothetical protein OXG10_05020 [Candidatus Dadabacteria bacterium]|nr:hypothetical protein [Candidatus Dadabacteria bacterium]
MTTARTIVDEVLSRGMTRDIWTGNYDKVLPVTLQGFELSAILPAVFYMFRFGERRGKGKFLETFSSGGRSSRERKKAATVKRIARDFSESVKFAGFSGETEKAILGDILLCFCLENARHALGREEQIQRVAPTHYMSSWVDLPEKVADLRLVPEMIVAMLASQEAEYIEQSADADRTWFPVGNGYEKNVLMRAFSQGVKLHGELASRTSDRFDEENYSVGLDQLIMIRLAQKLKQAPDRLRGGGEGEKISNQRPISERAANEFSEDIRRFVRSYANVIPRYAFVELLESCVSIGMTTILTSTVNILFDWAEKGEIAKSSDQKPAALFVDCSNGVNIRLRSLAEQSMDDFMRRIERFCVVLMGLRLLDYGARYDRKIRKLQIPTKPRANAWLDMLGDLLHKRRPEAQQIIYNLEQKAEELADHLEEGYAEAAHVLRNTESEPNPVWRLAESLTLLQSRKNTTANFVKMIESALLVGRPNGLASKRSVTRKTEGTGKGKRREVRSLVFTDPVLDYLVHRHALPSGGRFGRRTLPLGEFIRTVRERYGLLIDSPPEGMTISNDLLMANRAILERRLRDLGLLIGVNDAEAMKRLSPRFEPHTENTNEVD